MSRFDRRRFLQGSGVLLSLPFLESVPALASPKPPKRFVIFFVGHGMPMNKWTPLGTPANYQLNDIFREPVTVDGARISLADLKDELTIIDGVDVASAMNQPGRAHNLASGHLLCGIDMQEGGPSIDHTLTGGRSFDAAIADHITGDSVAFKAQHYAVRKPYEVCYTGPAEPVSRLQHPTAIINSLWSDYTSDDPAVRAGLVARKRGILDATKANIDALNPTLSAGDKARLDEYLTRIEELERRINAPFLCPPMVQAPLSRSPDRDWGPETPGFSPDYDMDIATPAILDVAVEALACDRTRCITFSMGALPIFHWLRDQNGDVVSAPITGDWHEEVVHGYWGQNNSQTTGSALLEDRLRVVARYQHSMYAYLIQKLKNRVEGNGTLLDNTVVLYVNEFGRETHLHDEHPWIIAGGGDNGIPKGQWLRYANEPHHRLILSIMRSFGMGDKVFGDPAYCTAGPLF